MGGRCDGPEEEGECGKSRVESVACGCSGSGKGYSNLATASNGVPTTFVDGECRITPGGRPCYNLSLASQSAFTAQIGSSPQNVYWTLTIDDHFYFPGSGQVQPWLASRL